jgi:hypothetical protein
MGSPAQHPVPEDHAWLIDGAEVESTAQDVVTTVGQLQPSMPKENHAGNDRSQGAADAARCRTLGVRSPRQTVKGLGTPNSMKS